MHEKNISSFLKKENNNLDFIRIIAATFVIIGHSYRSNPQPGQIDIIESLTGFTYSAALSVKLFFFISGLLVTDSIFKKQSIPVFFASRFFRIVPGLLFLLIITALIIGPIVSTVNPSSYFANFKTYKYVMSNMAFYTNYELPGVFDKNAWKSVVNVSLWTLRLEVKCYLALLFVFFFLRTKKIFYNILIVIIFIDAIFNLQLIGTGPMEHSLLPMCFALGAFMAINKNWVVVNKLVLFISLLATVCLWHTKLNEIMFIIFCCLFTIALCRNRYVKKIKIKHDISYGIYLWGFLVQQCVFYYMGPQNLYIYMLISVAIAAVLGYISFILVERNFMKIGKSVSDKLAKYKI